MIKVEDLKQNLEGLQIQLQNNQNESHQVSHIVFSFVDNFRKTSKCCQKYHFAST